jgi:hypothetical protein
MGVPASDARALGELPELVVHGGLVPAVAEAPGQQTLAQPVPAEQDALGRVSVDEDGATAKQPPEGREEAGEDRDGRRRLAGVVQLVVLVDEHGVLHADEAEAPEHAGQRECPERARRQVAAARRVLEPVLLVRLGEAVAQCPDGEERGDHAEAPRRVLDVAVAGLVGEEQAQVVQHGTHYESPVVGSRSGEQKTQH